MKYYVYISKNKIDTLYNQINSPQDNKTEISAGFDLIFAKGGITRTESVKDTDYSRLQAVLDQLENADQIGTLDETKPYIKGTFDMHWTTDDDVTAWRYTMPKKNPRNATNPGILILAGSKSNLTDASPNKNSPMSLPPALLAWMQKFVSLLNEPDQNKGEIDELIFRTYSKISGFVGMYEFIAKVYYRGQYHGTKTILASPLYVSMADETKKTDDIADLAGL